MKPVLIACEFSGIVRDAFLARGIDAISCDLLPSERPGPHIQGDVRAILDDGWSALIAFPPCTFVCNSGVRWLYGGKGTVRDPERWAAMEQGARFIRELLDAPIDRIAIENPVMHGWAQAIVARPPTQSVQPWQFGHGEIKRTCLWTIGLPPLVPTEIVPGRVARVHRATPSPDRWAFRSRTYQGIADAMAEQWGSELARV
jgi:hypothetical protein